MHKTDVAMSTTLDRSHATSPLRTKAEAQLQAGTAPATSYGSMGVDTLRLLHRLSSDPDHAADALKLLHELQVHQVEIDLQHEEIAAHERAVEADLHRYQALYDYAPLGYLLVDVQGRVIQANLAAAELFGVGRDELEGQPVDSVLNPQQRPRLHDLLQRVATSGGRESCVARASVGTQGPRPMQFMAAIAPGRERLLLACCECAPAE